MATHAWADAPKEAPAFKLELKEADGLPNGKVATLKGTATPAGDKFFVENIGVMQPVVVTLIAQTKGDVIKLVLGKQRWDESIKEAETGPDGQVTVKLRTQGELRMTVKAEEPKKKYWMIVWVGSEVLPTLAPAVTPKDGSAPAGSGGPPGTAAGGSSPALTVIAVALVAIALLLLVVVVRRRGSK